MPSQKSSLRIANLTPALRALRKIAPDAHDGLKDASGQFAMRVVRDAQGRAGRSRQASKAAASLRPRRGDVPQVALGGASTPFALGAEFGGGRYGRGTPTAAGGYTTQFPPWLGSGSGAGYFLWPTVRILQPWLTEAYLEALEDALDTAVARGSA